MRVLIVGSGGREHALAWAIAFSPLLSKLYIAPGNPGTAELGENVAVRASDIAGLVEFAKGAEIDLVIDFGGERWAVEVKRSLANPAPSKGFYNGCEDIEATRRIVLYPGTENFRLSETIEVMPLARLLAELPGEKV